MLIFLLENDYFYIQYRMFKSIDDIKYLECDINTHEYSSIYKIIDDDFQEEVEYISMPENLAPRKIVEVKIVISTYSKRSLNVSKNLFLLFKTRVSYTNTIEEQIKYCMKYIKDFDKYKDGIEKYLILT
jgi:hypothetical protein